MSDVIVQDAETRELLENLAKAQEILELFQRAMKLGYTLQLEPEQLKSVVAILESGHLHKKHFST